MGTQSQTNLCHDKVQHQPLVVVLRIEKELADKAKRITA